MASKMAIIFAPTARSMKHIDILDADRFEVQLKQKSYDIFRLVIKQAFERYPQSLEKSQPLIKIGQFYHRLI
jgi:hypothetical protein